MDNLMISYAKNAYLLSTCNKLTRKLMYSTLNQYSRSKTVATRHYFEIWIILNEKDNDNFGIGKLYSRFLGSVNNNIINYVDDFNSNILNENDLLVIKNKLIINNIVLDDIGVKSLYSLAALIKYFKKLSFKYLFIPVIVDYGRNSNVVHQTGFIFDLYNSVSLFYEPYGIYKKYDKFYDVPIKKILQCINDFDIYTYHRYMGLTDGIQNIIIKTNNNNYNEYIKKYDIIINKLHNEFPGYNFLKNCADVNSVDNTDKTINILSLLDNINSFKIDILTDYKKNIYFKIMYDVLELYYYYSSKTCVSITITEINDFFRLIQDKNDIKNTSERIKIIYSEYSNTSSPNIILMQKIYKLLDLIPNNSKIKDVINLRMKLHNTFDKIY